MSVFSFPGFHESCLAHMCHWSLRCFFRSLGGRSNIIQFVRSTLRCSQSKSHRAVLFKGRNFWKVSREAALGKAADGGSQAGGAVGQAGTRSLWRGRPSVCPSATARTPHRGDSTQRSTPTVTAKQQIQSNHITHSCREREDRRLIPLVKGLLAWQITFVLIDEPVENILTYDY